MAIEIILSLGILKSGMLPLLIAQSQVEKMTLATVDSAFDRYEIDRL